MHNGSNVRRCNRVSTKSSGPVGWQDFPIAAYVELDGRMVPIRSMSLDEAAARALLLLENTIPREPRKKEPELVGVAGASGG